MTTAYRVWAALGKGRDPAPNEDRGKYMVKAWTKARKLGFTADEFAQLPRWFAESAHSFAAFARDGGHDGLYDYVFRHCHLDARLTLVRAWLAGEERARAAPGGPVVNGAALAVWETLEAMRPRGSKPYPPTAATPEEAAAVSVLHHPGVGGWPGFYLDAGGTRARFLSSLARGAP